MKLKLTYGLIVVLLLGACEKWYDTDEVSHESELASFTLNGDEFMSVVRNDSLEYEEPGATAYANGEELTVHVTGGADYSKEGVYLVYYTAYNQDELRYSARRIIAVTSEPVEERDLSGTYISTQFGEVKMKVEQLHSDGWYECEEVLGHPSFEVDGQFVDMGDHELLLLPGEDGLRYGASDGDYTLSTLYWKIKLIDEPNAGVEIDVLWRKEFKQ